MKRLSFICLAFLLSGCDPLPPQVHKVSPSGDEYGVRLNLKTEEGARITLICPSLKGEPRGAHGRECYIDGSGL